MKHSPNRHIEFFSSDFSIFKKKKENIPSLSVHQKRYELIINETDCSVHFMQVTGSYVNPLVDWLLQQNNKQFNHVKFACS